MSMKEIEKLKEKVDKDPNSKLFVPLAEEYRKEGMMDEAIAVLQLGLERQPGYMSARVSLGKIYLEKGQMSEARVEFENVVQSIPDNLYAHKKLAEIYRDTGERDLAIKAFRAVLKLNPMDEEILNNLRDLEGTPVEQSAPEPQPGALFAEKKAAAVYEEEGPFAAMNLGHTSEEEVKTAISGTGEELDAFKESLFGIKAEAGTTDEGAALEEGVDAEVAEMPDSDAGPFSFKEDNDVTASPSALEGDVPEVEGLPDETDEVWSFGPEESGPVNESFEGAADAEQAEITEETETNLSFDDMATLLKNEGLETAGEDITPVEAGYVSGEMFRAQGPSGSDSDSKAERNELLRAAEGYISDGEYLGAMNTYQRILAGAPDDKMTLQRVEELRSLLKLMGKDKEILLAKLNAFLGAIKKRGDEFHKRT